MEKEHLNRTYKKCVGGQPENEERPIGWENITEYGGKWMGYQTSEEHLSGCTKRQPKSEGHSNGWGNNLGKHVGSNWTREQPHSWRTLQWVGKQR